jgi:uncharacterized protein
VNQVFPHANRPAWLYHGSQVRTSRLEPRAARGVGPLRDSLRAVYASHDEFFATAFGLPLGPDDGGELAWSLDYFRGAPRITIRAGVLDTQRVGYLYRVPADRFVPLDDRQWVAYRTVVPHGYRVLDPARYGHWVRLESRTRARPTGPARRHAAGASSVGPVPSAWSTPPSRIDFDRLWRYVAARRPARTLFHGPDHWRRVEYNALTLAARTGADVDVVRLFALFHDCRRRNDGADRGHGARGAAFATKLRGTWFDLPDEAFEQLRLACIWHTDSLHHDHPTIGTCWDADRLDLGRVGVVPRSEFMSTDAGRELAHNRSVGRATRTRPPARPRAPSTGPSGRRRSRPRPRATPRS